MRLNSTAYLFVGCTTKVVAFNNDQGFHRRKVSISAASEEQLQAIWNWEQEQPQQRLVEYDAIQEGLAYIETLDLDDDGTQEGLAALLEGMRTYPKGGDETFQSYASRLITRGVEQNNAADRDIRLPRKVRAILERATELIREKPGVKVEEMAEQLKLPVHRLVDYLRLVPSTLSMESTVKVLNPGLDENPTFRDKEEFETRKGWHLDTGDGVRKDELIDEYLDEMVVMEGDDEAWVQEAQIAGPLSDMIPDDTLDVDLFDDDIVIEELIRTNLSRVLSSTLDPQQVQVIRLTFGLDGMNTLSVNEVAKQMGLESETAAEVLRSAIVELRSVYADKYLQSEGGEEGIEESI